MPSIALPLFVVLSGVSVLGTRRVALRSAFTVYVCLGTVLAAAGGENVWPFESWILYREPTPAEVDMHLLLVADDRGRLLPYDDRALGRLTTSTNLSRYAQRMVHDWNGDARADQLARFMLQHANRYRDQVLAAHPPSLLRRLSFPPHQFSQAWTVSQLVTVDRFVAVIVKRVHVRFSSDGREVIGRTEEVLGSFPAPAPPP